MDIFSAEAALAGFVARVTSRELNQCVFSGGLPSFAVEGIGVAVEAAVPPSADRQCEVSAQADFCFADRNELENALHALLAALPQYDTDGLAGIEAGDALDISKTVRRGIPVYRALFHLKIAYI